MGADLIVHIVFVPTKITAAMKKRAQKRIDQIVGLVDKQLKLVLPDREMAWEDLPAKLQDIGKELENSYGLTGAEDVLDRIKKDLGDPKLVDNLTDFLLSPATRDSAWRGLFPFSKKHRVVVAGDMSWGDPPDGEGFQALCLLFIYGLDKCFGVS
jgi:hypothetical protein